MIRFFKFFKEGAGFQIFRCFFIFLLFENAGVYVARACCYFPDGAAVPNIRDTDSWNRKKTLTILFTNDMHSGTVPLGVPLYPGDSTARQLTDGGYARLATLLERESALGRRRGAVIVVDAGDIAMGTLFQTVFREIAFEYRTLGKLGYDAFVFGNHDFDLGPSALAQMLETGAEPGERLPVLLSANLRAMHGSRLERVLKESGSAESVLLEREGMKIGLLGVMGRHSYSVTVCKDSLLFVPPLDAAGETVEKLKKAGADFIIALSHGGTMYGGGKLLTKNWERSEDGKLALRFPRLDAVVSGHDHQALVRPIYIGNTPVVSAGSHNRYLGKLVLEKGNTESRVVSYELLPISDTIRPHPAIMSWVDSVLAEIDSKLYRRQGIRPFDTAGRIPSGFSLEVDPAGNLALGAYIAASYREAVLKDNPALAGKGLIGLVPYGSIRTALPKGPVTYEQVFNVLSLGEGPGATAGYPLVMAWLSGREIKDLCELNATVAPGMEDARLFFAGLEFTYRPRGLPFCRVSRVRVGGKPLEKDTLYPVVTGMYTAKLMGLLKSASYGLLSVQPKDSEGTPVFDLPDMFPGKGRAVAEWTAFAQFIGQGGLDGEAEKAAIVKEGIGILWVIVAAVAAFLIGLPVYLVYRIRRKHSFRSIKSSVHL